jgi:hypothetical protein
MTGPPMPDDRSASREVTGERVAGHTLRAIDDDAMRSRLQQTATYTLLVLTLRASEIRPEDRPVIWEHGRRNMALVDAGLLAVVLPVGDGSGLAGVGVFTVGPDQVREIMDADPGVRAGLFDYEVHVARGFPGSTLP